MLNSKLPDYILFTVLVGMLSLAAIDPTYRDDFTHMGNTVLLFYMGRASNNISTKQPKL